MSDEQKLNLQDEKLESVEEYKFEPIKGYPMLHWKGKRPFTSTQYYPAQLKENHGEEVEGWMNKIFWGDNIQVMSHLLKEFRGKIDLVYIDPPFDSKADYKKKITFRGTAAENNQNVFEEKQYTDIWSNDEFLQFIYERLILLRELMSENGSIYLHCDSTKGHYIKVIMDEVFGPENFKAEIAWKKTTKTTSFKNYGTEHDSIFFYTKSIESYCFYQDFKPLKESELKSKYIYWENEDGSIIKLNAEQKEGKNLPNKGRRFRGVPLLNMNQNRPNLKYDFLGHTRVWASSKENLNKLLEEGLIFQFEGSLPQKKGYLDENKGAKVNDVWDDIPPVNSQAKERTNYPTQKPERLIERIINVSTNPGDLVFDCFMGSGTTQSVALKLGRKYIGADINLGAIQTTTKRLLNISEQLKINNPTLEFEDSKEVIETYLGFSVYNVNNYDVFRNPVQAKDLLKQALEIQDLPNNNLYDGEKDGRMVKIMPINRIATRADLNELITGFNYKEFERKNDANPGKPVEYLLLLCMGHEPDLKAHLEKEVHPFKIDIEVVDILRDKSNLEFKRDSEAQIEIEDGKLVIKEFYPMNLLQKLSLMKENVEDWKELTESVMVDFNYDGSVFEPKLVDVPDKNELVKGSYPIPEDVGTIRVKITDLLSESIEVELQN